MKNFFRAVGAFVALAFTGGKTEEFKGFFPEEPKKKMSREEMTFEMKERNRLEKEAQAERFWAMKRQKQGIKRFEYGDVVIYARNVENAMRKYNNLQTA